MFTFGLTGGVHGFDPLVLLLIALVLEAYIGDAAFLFGRLPHPVALIGNLIGLLERKLNRDHRSPMDRAVRGLLLVIIVTGLAGTVGWAVAWLSQNHDFGVALELIVLVLLLAQRGLYDHVRAVAVALKTDGLDAGRGAVAHIVGRDPLQLDEYGVARASLESLAESFCDGVVAPAFWYLLFGLPGLLAYKAINTMDSMIGHTTPRYRAFGMVAARMDDIVNLIPARLSGLFIVIAALFAPHARPGRALKVMLRDAGKHRSLNAGWPEGAMAGAFGLALAGPRRYREHVADDPWIGDGRARATPVDIRRGLYLYLVACLINGGWVATVAVIRYSYGA
jgi:adenosylcobinamide-phosphate synthase